MTENSIPKDVVKQAIHLSTLVGMSISVYLGQGGGILPTKTLVDMSVKIIKEWCEQCPFKDARCDSIEDAWKLVEEILPEDIERLKRRMN